MGCVAISEAISSIASGSLEEGLKAAAFAFVSAGTFDIVGTAIQGMHAIGQAVVHGVVNGALNVAQGGNFLVGMATGALGKIGGILGQAEFGLAGTGDMNAVMGRTMFAAAAGCAGAVIAKGSCGQGAFQAGLAHLFNGEGVLKRNQPPELKMKLNSKDKTSLILPDGTEIPVFSGVNEHINNPGSIDKAFLGPLPKGEYYIVDRPTGRFWGALKTWLLGRGDWFALYRKDGIIDDYTYVNGIRRGEFRMHPGSGSEGCVTFCSINGFKATRDYLLRTPNSTIPNTNTRYYGTLKVD